MRLLVVSDLYPPDVIGGYEVACGQVVDGLRRRGHEVRVLTTVPRQPVAPHDHVVRRLRLADEWSPSVMGRFPVLHRVVHSRSRFVDALNVDELIRTIDAFEPEAVYLCSLIGIGGLGLVAALQHLGIPWVWQLGDCLPTRLCSGRLGLLPGLVGEFNRRIEGTYIAVSSRVIEEIEASGIALRGRVELLPNWIVGSRAPAASRRRQAGEPLRIVSAGQVHRDKGVGILLQALAALRDEGLGGFRLDVYGTILDPSLVDEAAALGLSDWVRFAGPIEHAQLMDRYSEYDVLAFPTQDREPFGMVAIEAASRGCVPLLTSRCGVGEWLVHGVHCLKVRRTAEGLAAAFRGLLTGAIPLDDLARRARHAVVADFHLDVILPRIEMLLFDASRRLMTPISTRAEVHRLARLAEAIADGIAEEAARPDASRMITPHQLRRLREARA